MRQNSLHDFTLADQDQVGLMIIKNLADQDWIGFNFCVFGLDSDWKKLSVRPSLLPICHFGSFRNSVWLLRAEKNLATLLGTVCSVRSAFAERCRRIIILVFWCGCTVCVTGN